MADTIWVAYNNTSLVDIGVSFDLEALKQAIEHVFDWDRQWVFDEWRGWARPFSNGEYIYISQVPFVHSLDPEGE